MRRSYEAVVRLRQSLQILLNLRFPELFQPHQLHSLIGDITLLHFAEGVIVMERIHHTRSRF